MNEQLRKKKRVKIYISKHAKDQARDRCHMTTRNILTDVHSNWRRCVIDMGNGTFVIHGKRARYIMDWNGVIITILKTVNQENKEGKRKKNRKYRQITDVEKSFLKSRFII